jgi:hypothetical protein
MAQAVFYVNGVQKSSAVCGDTIVFAIPGYSQVWMTQYQNGQLQFDGAYNVPAPPYATSCSRDVGTFQGTAWELINGQKGNVLATWTFQITPLYSVPSGGVPVTSPSVPQTCTTGLCSPSNPTSPSPGVINYVPPSPSPSVPYASGPGVAPGGPGGLSPFGDLPGTVPSATLGGSSGQPVPGSPPPSGSQFDFMAFAKSHLFWLLIALLVLVWLMTRDGRGRG